MKIVVDIFGGDHAPHETVKGCVEALNEKDGFSLILTGMKDLIENELKKYKYDASRIEIVDAKDVITNEEVPTSAIKQKKESSLVLALSRTKNDPDVIGLVGAGSTGAFLAGGIFNVGRIKGVQRPALAPVLPTKTGGVVTVVDCGANIDCRPEFLAQFAMMGSAYMKAAYGVENPKVALVSNGTEDKKGNELTSEAFKLLKGLPINFVGNMEAREAVSGDYDVLVCDGFVGNVLIKSVEGTASMVMKMVKNAIMGSTSAKIGYALFMKKAFNKLKNDMDYSNKGGAPLLGIEKIMVKSHGSSKAATIKASIFQVIRMHEHKLVENIKEGLTKMPQNEGNN